MVRCGSLFLCRGEVWNGGREKAPVARVCRDVSIGMALCKTLRPIQYPTKLFIKPDITTNLFHDFSQDTVHAQAFHFGSSPIPIVSAPVLTPPRKMSEDLHNKSEDRNDVKCDVYIGYSVHFDNPKDRTRVLHAVGKPDVRSNQATFVDFKDFIFVKAERAMNKNAIAAWRYRNQVTDLSVCLHEDESTVVAGLSDTMQPMSKRPDCGYFIPLRIRGATAAASGATASTLDQCEGVTTDFAQPAGRATVVKSHPEVELTKLPPIRESLTPLCCGPDDRLFDRRYAYKIGPKLGGGSHGEVRKAETSPGNYVAVKILKHPPWTNRANKMKAMQEVYWLERCLDHDVYVVQILDVFLDKSPPHLHIVLEFWGLSGTAYRTHKGYGRREAQPTNHVRTLCLHLCTALSYMHERLGICHTDVKLDNVLVVDLHGDLVDDISCKLADVGSAEEVCLLFTPTRWVGPIRSFFPM